MIINLQIINKLMDSIKLKNRDYVYDFRLDLIIKYNIYK